MNCNTISYLASNFPEPKPDGFTEKLKLAIKAWRASFTGTFELTFHCICGKCMVTRVPYRKLRKKQQETITYRSCVCGPNKSILRFSPLEVRYIQDVWNGVE